MTHAEGWYDEDDSWNPLPLLLVMISFVMVFCGMPMVIVDRYAIEKDANYQVAADLWGLTSGKSYPLILGDKVGSASLGVTMKSGMFYQSTSVKMRAGSAITVIFIKDGRQWNLEIPTAVTTKVINNKVPQSVKLTLSQDTTRLAVHKSWFFSSSCTDTASSCGAYLSETGKIKGLGLVIQEGLVGAEFTLSQETADTLAGKR